MSDSPRTAKWLFASLMSCVIVAQGCSHTPAPVAGPQVLRIYLARHGQTDWNLEKRLQGQTDTELNDTGRSQARALAQRIEGIGIEKVYSSALRRSRETALIAAGGLPVESLPSLNEQSIGSFEGLYVDGRDPGREAEFKRRTADREDALDGGESDHQFFSRVCESARSIVKSNPDGSILIVGHGGTNSMILRCLMELSADEGDAISQANDELYMVEIRPAASPRIWKWIARDKLGEL